MGGIEPPPEDRTMSIKRGTCATCTFFKSDVYPQQCRSRSPLIFVINGEVKTQWPNVDSDDWCGDWEDAIGSDGIRRTYDHKLNEALKELGRG